MSEEDKESDSYVHLQLNFKLRQWVYDKAFSDGTFAGIFKPDVLHNHYIVMGLYCIRFNLEARRFIDGVRHLSRIHIQFGGLISTFLGLPIFELNLNLMKSDLKQKEEWSFKNIAKNCGETVVRIGFEALGCDEFNKVNIFMKLLYITYDLNQSKKKDKLNSWSFNSSDLYNISISIGYKLKSSGKKMRSVIDIEDFLNNGYMCVISLHGRDQRHTVRFAGNFSDDLLDLLEDAINNDSMKSLKSILNSLDKIEAKVSIF